MKCSAIPWTDYSAGDLNFVTGCTPISEGCQHCYARTIYERHGWDFSQVRTHPEKLERLRRWHIPGQRGGSGVSDSVCSYVRGTGSHPLAFVCDTGDLFHREVSDSFLLEAFDLMVQRSDVTWQVLTKRIVRAMDFLRAYVADPGGGMGGQLPRHIWIGVTAENQQRAAQRIPTLLQVPAKVRFVSVEPLLEPVDLSAYLVPTGPSPLAVVLQQRAELPLSRPALSWVICGAESGPRRRPFNVDWAEDLYRQCQEARVPFFGKQDSSAWPGRPLLLGSREIHEFPEV